MNEYEDEIIMADVNVLKEQVEGLHELFEVLLSCMDRDESCCTDGKCDCKEE